jgi:hypothetical protein
LGSYAVGREYAQETKQLRLEWDAETGSALIAIDKAPFLCHIVKAVSKIALSIPLLALEGA